jgi:F-type H+-transporting ATPase subunit delta
LEPAQERAFVERLERSSGKTLKATFAVDLDLIGGARVQLGDHLVDSSVRAQLNALRTRLSGS